MTLWKLGIPALAIVLVGCETAYYSAWEKVGVHKRDILVDRVEDAQEAQEDTQEQFRDALEQYRSVVNFDGGDLEKLYNRLQAEYDDSEAAAATIKKRIEAVEDVAEDLFEEWADEAGQIGNRTLRRDSEQKLRDTKRQYGQLIAAMKRAEKKIYPVLDTLRDQTLYLKHNLNARAISALKGELKTINSDVGQLIQEMQKAIDEADSFIQRIRQ